MSSQELFSTRATYHEERGCRQYDSGNYLV